MRAPPRIVPATSSLQLILPANGYPFTVRPNTGPLTRICRLIAGCIWWFEHHYLL